MEDIIGPACRTVRNQRVSKYLTSGRWQLYGLKRSTEVTVAMT